MKISQSQTKSKGLLHDYEPSCGPSFEARLQELLPKFKPADIEAFLQLQEVVEAAQQRYGEPGQPSVMSKLFEIPMDVLLSALPKLKLDDSAAAAFDTFKLLMEDGDFELLSSTVSSLLGPDQQRQLIGGCTDQNIRIVCNDQEHVSTFNLCNFVYISTYIRNII